MDFIYLAPGGKQLFSAPFSCKIVLPASTGKNQIEQTAGSYLWIAHEKKPPYLAARIFVEHIEEYTEGHRKGDFVLTGNRAKSMWIADGTEEGGAWSLPPNVITNNKINKLDESQTAMLIALIKKMTTKTFAEHPADLLDSIPSPKEEKRLDQRQYIEQQYDLVIKNIPLSLAAQRANERCSPFVSVTLAKIFQSRPEWNKLSKNQFIDLLEPKTNVSKERRVDTDMQEVVLSEIHARSFVAAAEQADKNSIAIKTEQAEKIHQSMLKDISEWLKQQGVTPMESSSVDLAFERENGIVMIEIKSANNENILDQGRTGIMQIAEYGIAFKDAKKIVDQEVLIIQCAGRQENLEHLIRLGKRCGVLVLFYNKHESWPARIAGFEKIIMEKNT